MSKFIRNAISLLTVSSLFLAGCGANQPATPTPKAEPTSPKAEEPKSTGKLKIVTTFYPMYDFTKNVVGDNAEVVALVPAGAEPHDWEPTAKDMETIKNADIFVYNGAGVESWVDKVLKSVNNEKLKVVEASKGIELMEGIEEEEEGHQHGEHQDEKVLDPHVWLDPVLAQKQVAAIENAVEQADSAHKDMYKRNADAYNAKLQELDKQFKDSLSSVKRKEFVTQHAAFAYLAKRYGLSQVPIAGLSPEEEPAPAKLAEIVKFAKEHQVKTIYFETLVSSKVADTVAKELGAKTAVLNPIEGLTEEEKAQNLDYIGVMKKNLDELKKGLNE